MGVDFWNNHGTEFGKDPLGPRRAYDRRVERAQQATGVDGDLLRELDGEGLSRLIRTKALESISRQARTKDFADGRARADEIYGQGDLKSILDRRRALTEGYTPEQMNAQRADADQAVNNTMQSSIRSVRSKNGAANLRGGLAQSQELELGRQSAINRGNLERDLFMKNMAAKSSAMDSFEKTAGNQTLGRLGTELGYASMGSGERSAIAQQLIGEDQAAATARSANRGGKK